MPERRAYLLDVTGRCPNERLMQELVDVLARYSYNEFFVFSARDRTDASPADEPTGENGTFLSPRLSAPSVVISGALFQIIVYAPSSSAVSDTKREEDTTQAGRTPT